MKKMLTMVAGSAILAGAAMGVAHAQKAAGPFADVPTDHWAYSSVEKLRDAGIVIGYPDGTYGGRRAMTRYEFATAIARLMDMLNGKIDAIKPGGSGPDLSAYALKTDIPSTAGLAKQSDLDALRTELTNRLTQNEGAVAALRDLVNQFQPELQRLGQNVAALNARVDALDKRLTAVETEQRRVTITGEMNFIARANVNTNKGSGVLPLDKDGYRIGTLGNDSIFNTPNVYHDILLNIHGRVSDNAEAVLRIDAGNYLPWLGSATEQSGFRAPGVNATPPATSFNVYEAYLATPVSLGPLGGASAKIGRFGTQFTPFTLKAVDPDSYTNLPETDSGNVIMDGAQISGAISGVRATAFASKASPIQNFSITGNPNGATRSLWFRPGAFGNGGSTYPSDPIDNLAGLRLTIGNPDRWTAGVTGVLGRTTVPGIDPNKGAPIQTVSVYGADFNGYLPFGPSGLTLDAEFAINPTGFGSRFGNVNSQNGNEAWKALLGYSFGNLNLKAGYREVYTNFNAPGYWGHIGTWQNPTNIRGPEVYGSYAFTPNLSLNAEGQFYQGHYNVGAESPLGRSDHLNRAAVGLKYGLTSAYAVDLGYEWVQWDLKNDQGLLAAAGKPTEQYITLGLGHNLNKNTAIKVMYQIIDYKDKGTHFDNVLGADTRGGVFVGQASVKF